MDFRYRLTAYITLIIVIFREDLGLSWMVTVCVLLAWCVLIATFYGQVEMFIQNIKSKISKKVFYIKD